MVSFGPGLAFGVVQSLRRSFSGSAEYLRALVSVRAHLAKGSSSDQSVDVQSVPVAKDSDRWWWFVVLWSVVVFTGRAQTVVRGPGLNRSECIGRVASVVGGSFVRGSAVLRLCWRFGCSGVSSVVFLLCVA